MNSEKQPGDELDEIFQAEEPEESLLTEFSNQDLIKLQQDTIVDITNLGTAVASLEKRFDCIEKLTEKAKITTEALASLSLQNRQFQENFHEREILLPVFLSLISIADRCREQIARFRKHREQSEGSLRPTAEKAFLFLSKAREADIAEIHNSLAGFGIEPVITEDDTFNASRQKVIQRIETEDTALSQKIAERLHPGYVRYDQIIRREYVNVYFLKS
jgi:hypothetical protein